MKNDIINTQTIQKLNILLIILYTLYKEGGIKMANEKILIIDDDADVRDVLQIYLEKNHFQVVTSSNGYQALQLIDEDIPDLIILDVMMPHLDGFELCQYIRKKTEVPILFYSSKNEDMDKIIGLSIGADDFIEKSTSFSVIVAKVRAHLRRTRTFPAQENTSLKTSRENGNNLMFPGLIIKLESADVLLDEESVKLSAKEYQLLCVLAKNPDRIYSVEQLFDMVWGEDSLGDYRTVLVHISNLRKKLEQNRNDVEYIQTFRGIGYKFNGFIDA